MTNAVALSPLMLVTDRNALKAAFVTRVSDNLPAGWAGQDALQEGTAYAVLNALAGGLADLMLQAQYAKKSLRFSTATSPELDQDSTDFLGASLPRSAGELDAAYAAAITQAIFSSAVTREAVYDAVQAYLGTSATFRQIEPFRPADVGCWDTGGFFDIDSSAMPGRIGDDDGGVGLIEITPNSASYVLPASFYALIEGIRAEGVLIGISVI